MATHEPHHNSRNDGADASAAFATTVDNLIAPASLPLLSILDRLYALGIEEVHVERGKPVSIRMTADAFMGEAEHVFSVAPTISNVRLVGKQPFPISELAEAPHLSRVQSLDLCWNGIGDAGARTLAESPHLGSLKTLELAWNGITDTGAKALADSPHLGRMQSLGLSGNRIGNMGVIALATSPSVRGLLQLDFRGNAICEAGARGLAGSRFLRDLEELQLGGNRIGDVGAIALARSPHLGNLRVLNLGWNEIGDAGANALAESRLLKASLSLDLRGNRTVANALQKRYENLLV